MHVGVQHIFTSHSYGDITDGQVFAEEVQTALWAEELGFDSVWPVEHHFFDYSFCPDNTEFLAYLAGRTSRIKLGTAAVILPWNEPLRVAEKISMLDHLSGGRALFGMGRGLSRREYAPFRGIEMDESRERFDEASAMICEALEAGFIQGDGPFYPQPRTEIRPRPERSFADRRYSVANSEDSVDAAARNGATMLMFAEREWEKRLPSIERYRAGFRQIHGREAPPVMLADFVYCAGTAEEAKDRARFGMGNYLTSLLEHYELMNDHLKDVKGYAKYGEQVDALNTIGYEGFMRVFLKSTTWGTPGQIIDTLRSRREVIGPFDITGCFRYGGLPIDEVEANMRLFAAEVLPELHAWSDERAAA
ncbi:MAG: LLM class flavin-dependent oxidoreductase [Acidimicrobiales bacterium]